MPFPGLTSLISRHLLGPTPLHLQDPNPLTGSPRIDDIDEFINMGFDQFGVCASEDEYVFSHNTEEHVKNRNDIDSYTKKLLLL